VEADKRSHSGRIAARLTWKPVLDCSKPVAAQNAGVEDFFEPVMLSSLIDLSKVIKKYN